MYHTTIVTSSESGDEYVYSFYSKNKPTLQQMEWWLKENANDIDEMHIYESITTFSTTDLTPKVTKLHKKDPRPEVEYL